MSTIARYKGTETKMSTLSNVYFTNLRSHAEEKPADQTEEGDHGGRDGKLDVDGKFVAIRCILGSRGT
jgi:hypothetical protein